MERRGGERRVGLVLAICCAGCAMLPLPPPAMTPTGLVPLQPGATEVGGGVSVLLDGVFPNVYGGFLHGDIRRALGESWEWGGALAAWPIPGVGTHVGWSFLRRGAWTLQARTGFSGSWVSGSSAHTGGDYSYVSFAPNAALTVGVSTGNWHFAAATRGSLAFTVPVRWRCEGGACRDEPLRELRIEPQVNATWRVPQSPFWRLGLAAGDYCGQLLGQWKCDIFTLNLSIAREL